MSSPWIKNIKKWILLISQSWAWFFPITHFSDTALETLTWVSWKVNIHHTVWQWTAKKGIILHVMFHNFHAVLGRQLRLHNNYFGQKRPMAHDAWHIKCKPNCTVWRPLWPNNSFCRLYPNGKSASSRKEPISVQSKASFWNPIQRQAIETSRDRIQIESKTTFQAVTERFHSNQDKILS